MSVHYYHIHSSRIRGKPERIFRLGAEKKLQLNTEDDQILSPLKIAASVI